MIFRSIRATWHHFKYLPLLSAITFSRGRSFARRSQALGVSIGWVLRWYPPARRWFEREFLKIFPDMPRDKRLNICQRMGVHMGRTLFRNLSLERISSRVA
jgi:KDO2-lipid IV(A) lauroyltransferase